MPQKICKVIGSVIRDIIQYIVEKITALFMYTWQCIGLYVIAMINDRYRELGFIIVGFCVGKVFYKTSDKHMISFLTCTLITWVVFWVLTSSTLTINQSIGVPIILGMLSQYATMICENIFRHISITDKKQ